MIKDILDGLKEGFNVWVNYIQKSMNCKLPKWVFIVIFIVCMPIGILSIIITVPIKKWRKSFWNQIDEIIEIGEAE
jgi:uncharacterized membrane protein